MTDPLRYAPELGLLRARLAPLLAARGPSGFEAAPARAWSRLANEFATVRTDALGSVHAVVNPGASPTIALIGHLDEIGLSVGHVDEQGKLWVRPIGTWDAAILYGQHVTVLTASGEVPGVIGTPPPHLHRTDSAPTMAGTWIDIGATDRADAQSVVDIGDPVVLAATPVDLRNGLIAGPALDNRLGALAVLEAARVVAEYGPTGPEVVAVASTREETSFGGARAASYGIAPDIALVVDTTFASDVPIPDIERAIGLRPLGSGPAIGRGAAADDGIATRLRRCAEELAIPYTIEAHGHESLTDADVVFGVGAGIRVGVVSIPTRHLHSAGEVADLTDLATTVELLAGFCLAPNGS